MINYKSNILALQWHFIQFTELVRRSNCFKHHSLLFSAIFDQFFIFVLLHIILLILIIITLVLSLFSFFSLCFFSFVHCHNLFIYF